MLSFKQFLFEMPTLDATSSELDKYSIKPPGKYDREETVGHTDNHEIRARTQVWNDGEKSSHPYHYLALDHDDKVHMSLRGVTLENGHIIANETRKHPDSTINAPDFYKAILHTGIHKGIRSGASQTYGGQSIWKRLHKDPEVEVTHHDDKTGKKIKLHTGDDFHKNYDQERPTHFKVRLRK